MTVVIPFEYHGSMWNNNELRYFLRSIDQFMYTDKVYVLGREFPEWLTNVEKIEIQREFPVKAKQAYPTEKLYENFWDTINKLKWCHENLKGDFLWCYDDVLMLREPEQEEVRNPIALYSIDGGYKKQIINARTRWGKTIQQAYFHLVEIIGDCGLYNFEHHLPLLYNAEMLRIIFKDEKNNPYQYSIPYAIHTVYFNEVLSNLIPKNTLEEESDFGVRFFNDGATDLMCRDSSSLESIQKSSEGKLWMCYSDQALFQNGLGKKSPLQEFCKITFPKKCGYEK